MTEFQPGVLNRPNRHAAEARHGMPNRLAHLPHLAVPPFAHRDAHMAGAEDLHLSRPGFVAVDDDALLQAGQVMIVGYAEDPCFIHPCHAVARVREFRGEVAVIGQNEEPFGIEVEPSNGVHIVAHAAEQVDDRRTALGIGTRRDVASRLVQQQVKAALDELDAAAVNADIIARGVGLGPELADGRAVDGHTSVEHELLRRAPRRDPRLGQNLL